MVDLQIVFPEADRAKMQKAIEYRVKMLGVTVNQAVHSAAYLVCKSLGASTKKAPEMRPIVRNPYWDARASVIEMERIEGMKGKRGGKWKVNMKDFRKTDARRAQFGVYKYFQTKPKKFVPIYRTGEYGQVRFVDKKTGQDLRFASRPEFKLGKESTVQAGGFTQHTLEGNPKRKIGRFGMAQNSFKWLQIASRGKQSQVNNSWYGRNGAILAVMNSGTMADTSVTITNGLVYIMEALKGGRQDVTTAMARAGRAMFGDVNRKLGLPSGGGLYK